METLLLILGILLMVIGLAGTILPALPGAPLVFAGALLISWVDGFEHVSGVILTILGILAALTLFIDVATTAAGAKRVGASPTAVTGAAVGMFLGLFFGFAGILFGPFIGAFAGELYASGGIAKAGKSGFGTWLGLLIGTVLKVGVVLSMIGTFVLAYLI